MDPVDINEPIKVGAVFQGAKIIPRWFVWKGKKREVKSLNYTWKDKHGREDLHHFSVSDGANTFELVFYAEQTTWRLSKTDA